MTPLLLLLQAAAGPAESAEARFDRCVALIRTDPGAAQAEAGRWSVQAGTAQGGDRFARACAGLAYAAEGKWPTAAGEFEAAALGAEAARDGRGAQYRAQSGNAWLAAGNAALARTALDSAIAAGTLSGFQRGEALLDRARAAVATGDTGAARRDLDQALIAVPADPLAWLLSATLARRTGDLPRAKKDIGEALRRAADDASVQLEAGNIAALGRDEVATRTAWAEAVRLAPGSPAGQQAAAALQQFSVTTAGTGEPPRAPVVVPPKP